MIFTKTNIYWFSSIFLKNTKEESPPESPIDSPPRSPLETPLQSFQENGSTASFGLKESLVDPAMSDEEYDMEVQAIIESSNTPTGSAYGDEISKVEFIPQLDHEDEDIMNVEAVEMDVDPVNQVQEEDDIVTVIIF